MTNQTRKMTKTGAYKKYVALSWWLLEAKILYYIYPELSTTSDAEYDNNEKEYLILCKENKFKNTVQNMVGVDKTRPSVKLAIDKLNQNGYRISELK